MEFIKKVSWAEVAAALAALGIVSTSDPDMAIVSVTAMVIVALFGLASKALEKPIGRSWLSITVYLIAFGLSALANPPAGGYPVWDGDPARYMEMLAAFVNEFGGYALALTGAATVMYNSILKIVVDKIAVHLLNG